ncbi:MAG: Altered inheritance of mitochondria protein 24, mitochondrial [Alyxoria varia]|nr:MAG: Altered inheritance of mitochondria protein 24, mitochondrial [Alyxoria varia]
MNINPPQPFRFKSTAIPIQIPNLGEWLPDTKFFRTMRETQTFKASAQALFKLRTWMRTMLWGDRLFLRFHGPTTIVLQSRAARLREALTGQEVDEIADSPAGSVEAAVASTSGQTEELEEKPTIQTPTKETMNYANVGKDGKVSFKS